MDDLYHPKEPLVQVLRWVIRLAVRILAIMMTGVILLGVVDVGWTLHQKAMAPPRFVLTISDILATFYIWATAGVVLAMSIGYWLVHRFTPEEIASPDERAKTTMWSGLETPE